MQIELFLLILSTLFFASILAGKAGNRFGVPALLLFLGVGMLFGTDSLGPAHSSAAMTASSHSVIFWSSWVLRDWYSR